MFGVRSVRRILKVILVTFAVLIIVGVASFGLIIGDVAGNFATDSKSLPNGSAIGRALVVYDPGLSGGAKDAATKIGYALQDSGYDVTLAGVKSSSAANLEGYGIVVVGGPIYAGKPASSIQTYLNNLNQMYHDNPNEIEAKIGVFGYGGVKIDNNDLIAVAQDVALLPNGYPVAFADALTKITSQDDVDGLIDAFVAKLLE